MSLMNIHQQSLIIHTADQTPKHGRKQYTPVLPLLNQSLNIESTESLLDESINEELTEGDTIHSTSWKP